MRKSVRLVGLMAGTAFVAFLGSSCAENAMFATRSDSPSANVLDRALNAARTARANGDLNAAASKLAYLVSIAPDNADILSEYGKVLTEMGQPDEALVYFKKAMAENSDDWKLYNAEGVAYDEKHDLEAARADYAKALQLNPRSSAVLNNAARSRMMAGDLVGAEALLAQANPIAQENGFFTSTQAQLSELELKSNPNAPVAALTPKMDVQAPLLPPAPAPTLPVEVHKAVPVASAAPATVSRPTVYEAAKKEAVLEAGVVPAQPVMPQATAAQAPAATAAPALASATPTVASSSAQAAAASTTPAVPAEPAPPVAANTAEVQPVQQAAAMAPVASKPAPMIEASASPAQITSPTPAVEKTDAAPATPQVIGPTQTAEAKPVPAAQMPKPAPVTKASKPAPATDTPTAAPIVEQAKATQVVEVANTATAVQAPAAPASTFSKPVLSAAAMREAALEAGVAPPAAAPDASGEATTGMSLAAASGAQASAAAPLTSAPSAAKTEKLYIRIGMFRSRTHARHVAWRLKSHDVHVARLTRHGRHWYRVWIRGVGDRPQVQDELASVHSLGYLHAHIIVKLESVRHLAQNSAPTIVASSGH